MTVDTALHAGSPVRTNLGRGDIVIGSIAMMLASPQNRWILAGIAIVFGYLVANGVVEFIAMTVTLLLAGLAGATIFALANAFFNPSMARGVLGEHMFTVTDEGLWEETQFNKSLHKWPSLDRITTIFGIVMIRVAGSVWHFIPLRSFASADEARSFISSLKHKVEPRFGAL